MFCTSTGSLYISYREATTVEARHFVNSCTFSKKKRRFSLSTNGVTPKEHFVSLDIKC